MLNKDYLDCAFNALSLDTDFVELCKLYGQINKYTNLTVDLTYLERFKAIYGDDLVKCVQTNNYNRYQRLKRFRKYVSWCLNTDGYCLFVTLTFDDDMLSKSFKYRKEKVLAFLKSCSPYYLANIDFGSENDREHYHALLYFPYEKKYQSFLSRCELKSKGIYICKEWKYWNEFIPCKGEKDDVTRLSKYITKLSNHAFKDTTKTCKYRTIYSDGITLLNKLVKLSKSKAVFASPVYGGLRYKSHIQSYVPNMVVGYKRVTNQIRDVSCAVLKEEALNDVLYKYQWKPFNDTFKPCDDENEFIDKDGNLTCLNDLPF